MSDRGSQLLKTADRQVTDLAALGAWASFSVRSWSGDVAAVGEDRACTGGDSGVGGEQERADAGGYAAIAAGTGAVLTNGRDLA